MIVGGIDREPTWRRFPGKLQPATRLVESAQLFQDFNDSIKLDRTLLIRRCNVCDFVQKLKPIQDIRGQRRFAYRFQRASQPEVRIAIGVVPTHSLEKTADRNIMLILPLIPNSDRRPILRFALDSGRQLG